MNRLIRIELRKILFSKTFLFLMGIYSLILIISLAGIEGFVNTIIKKSSDGGMSLSLASIYSYPNLWHNLSFLADHFKLFLAFILIIFTTNEYSYKTIRQNFINGVSKFEYLMCKEILIVFMALISSAILILTGLILGFLNNETIMASAFFEKAYFVPTYFIEIILYLNFILFFANLFKRSGLTIMVGGVYMIAEGIAFGNTSDAYSFLYPLWGSFRNLIQVPNSKLMKMFGMEFIDYVPMKEFITSVAYGVVFFFANLVLIKKRDH